EHLVLALPQLHRGPGADVAAQLVAAVEQYARMKGGANHSRPRSSRQLFGGRDGGEVGIGGGGVAIAAALLGKCGIRRRLGVDTRGHAVWHSPSALPAQRPLRSAALHVSTPECTKASCARRVATRRNVGSGRRG